MAQKLCKKCGAPLKEWQSRKKHLYCLDCFYDLQSWLHETDQKLNTFNKATVERDLRGEDLDDLPGYPNGYGLASEDNLDQW